MAGKEFAVDDKQVAAPLEAAAALSARAAPGTVVLGPSVASRLGHGFVIRTLGDGDDRQLLLGDSRGTHLRGRSSTAKTSSDAPGWP